MASKRAEIEPELCKITPKDATEWLKGNSANRPVRARHVTFLANQMKAGKWLVNGETIKISDDDTVLDGQHRLLAVIESDTPIQSWVMYGIPREAMATIDTGIVRSAADVVGFTFDGRSADSIKAVSTAARWCAIIDTAGIGRFKDKQSNQQVVAYIKAHPSLWTHCEIVSGYPRVGRPLSVSVGTALLELMQRKDHDQAQKFIRDVYTGELLSSDTPAYQLRGALLRDSERNVRYPEITRIKMAIKAWNLVRRGMKGTIQGITVTSKDDKLKVL